ncbi:HEAT repeat domain-containing protein [Streptomyces sp. NPDC096136]|uniref:HEAT repeat domain-containing protein n=1 Tax=Streptomyces sp. NPDC096136 TaxID=3366076 RepID=UPI00381672EE
MINDLDGIDGIDWTSMGHAYGPGGDIPGWLKGMADPDPDVRRDAFGGFYGAVHHQGDIYPSTVASLPFLLGLADDPATPDRAAVAALVLSIGREAADRDDDCIRFAPDGTESTAPADAMALLRARAEAFVRHAADPDPGVRHAGICGVGLFLDDADRAVAILRDRLPAEPGTEERLLVIRTMASLALRLPAARPAATAWLAALADDPAADPDIRLGALVHRARCAPQDIAADTVPTAITLLGPLAPPPDTPDTQGCAPTTCACAAPAPEAATTDEAQAAPAPEEDAPAGDVPADHAPAQDAPAPEPAPADGPPAQDVPPQIAAAFEDLDRHGRVHAPTTTLLRTFHTVLDDRVAERTALLTAQLGSPDPATRYDAIAMAKDLIGSWRGDHTALVALVAQCLLPRDPYTTAAAAECLGSLGPVAEPAREALADCVAGHRDAHGPDVWASPRPQLRRAHQEAVMALARLGDPRALPSLLTALDGGTDAWRAVQVAGDLGPAAAGELVPRLTRLLDAVDFAKEWTDMSAGALVGALAELGDPAAVPALARAVAAAVRHEQWRPAASALEALASFGTAGACALDVVRPLADAQDVDLRAAATAALWALARDPADAVPRLVALLDGYRLREAAEVLALVGPPAGAAAPRLREMLTASYDWTRIHAAAALWEIGGEAGAGALVPVLLAAWAGNGATSNHVLACLSRMGPAAAPALPRIEEELALPRRTGRFGSIAHDEEVQHLCRTLRDRLAG